MNLIENYLSNIDAHFFKLPNGIILNIWGDSFLFKQIKTNFYIYVWVKENNTLKTESNWELRQVFEDKEKPYQNGAEMLKYIKKKIIELWQA